MIKVYKEYQLVLVDGKKDLQYKKLINGRVVISEIWANHMNENSSHTYYEEDKAATEEYYKKRKEDEEIKKELILKKKDESISIIKDVLNDAAVESIKKRGRKPQGGNQ